MPEYSPWTGSASDLQAGAGQGLRLDWRGNNAVDQVGLGFRTDTVTGYRVYRNIYPIGQERAYGIPRAEFFDSRTVNFEDRLDLREGVYYFTVVPMNSKGQLVDSTETLAVEVRRVTTVREANQKGLIGIAEDLEVGDYIDLAFHPLGTDYLGRDMLARLMAGARVSLFIGIGAPLIFCDFRDFIWRYGWVSRRKNRSDNDAVCRFYSCVTLFAFHDPL